MDAYAQNVKDVDAALAGLVQNGNLAAAQAGIKQVTDSMEKGGLSYKEATALLPQVAKALGVTSGASLDAAAAAKIAAAGTDEAASAFKDYMDSAFGASNDSAQLASDLDSLGNAFATNGSTVAGSGKEIQSVIQDIYDTSGGGQEAANQMQGFFDALVQGGYASASQLSGLQAIIFQLTQGKGATAVQPFDLSALAKGFNTGTVAARKTAAATQSVQKEVHTLSDYASDLGGVFKRAFDIRFSSQSALDSISSGWSSIAKAASDAADAEAKAMQTMQELAADKSLKEYWLTVANSYGDTLRATELQAELAQNALDTASAQKDLQSAQDDSNKSLVGNSDAAIKNRSDILGLVSGYQSYIQALASSGASQAELQSASARLKQDFLAQATQLGYNSSELGTYSAAFDDVSKAIARVPRNITVTANVDPALQALNEFAAKAASAGAAAGSGFANGIAGGLAKAGRGANIAAQIAFLQNEMARAAGPSAPRLIDANKVQIAALSARLNSGNYRSGTAWTGNGNPWDIAGVVHGREAVLNQRGTQAVPSQFINAANQGRNPWDYAPQQQKQISFPKTLEVQLSPVDRDLLAQGSQVTVVLTADQVGQASSTSFSDDSRRGGS